MTMRASFEAAVQNIAGWGDTDIFPLAIEGHVMHDRPSEIVRVLEEVHANFDTAMANNAPVNESSLALVGYTGFRWATQIDPMWNAYLLGLVIEIGRAIEIERVARDRRVVFSYRFDPDPESNRLFADDAWQAFKDRSLELADMHGHVLVCDIADFYARIYHHRVENSLNLLALGSDIPARIMKLLGHFAGAASYGLPVGGPAARLLSELLLNRTDRLLLAEGVNFVRFADDYHVFVTSRTDAFEALRSISEKLLRNEGLTLQKGKTRIMSAAEFRGSSMFEDRVLPEESPHRAFLAISLRFDPYSPTAEEDYETLRAQIRQYDITGMLARELQKSRVNPALTRRLIQAIQFLSPAVQDAAVLSILDSVEVLAPLIPSVLRMLHQIYPQLRVETKAEVQERLRELMTSGHYLLRIEINLAYALRVLALQRSDENETLLAAIYDSQAANFVRRDIVLIMGHWRAEYWISDKKNYYAQLHPWVKRALLVASFVLGDEGRHWRRSIRPTLSSFDSEVADWAASKMAAGPWVPPI